VIAFEANAEGTRVLAAMKVVPDGPACRSRPHAVMGLPLR
jgi:hypothetical protein